LPHRRALRNRTMCTEEGNASFTMSEKKWASYYLLSQIRLL